MRRVLEEGQKAFQSKFFGSEQLRTHDVVDGRRGSSDRPGPEIVVCDLANDCLDHVGFSVDDECLILEEDVVLGEDLGMCVFLPSGPEGSLVEAVEHDRRLRLWFRLCYRNLTRRRCTRFLPLNS